MEIHYRLQKMEESGFSFKPDYDYANNNTESVNFQFTHQLRPLPESGELSLSMDVEITPEKSSDVLAKQSIYCVFWLEPFDKVIQIKDDSFSTTEPMLIDTFINIAIGALRGMLVKNLKGTPLAGAVLPLIPMDVIRQNSMQKK